MSDLSKWSVRGEWWTQKSGFVITTLTSETSYSGDYKTTSFLSIAPQALIIAQSHESVSAGYDCDASYALMIMKMGQRGQKLRDRTSRTQDHNETPLLITRSR